MGEGVRGHGVARKGARQNNGDGGESGEADASGTATRATGQGPPVVERRLRRRRPRAVRAILLVLVLSSLKRGAGGMNHGFFHDIYKREGLARSGVGAL